MNAPRPTSAPRRSPGLDPPGRLIRFARRVKCDGSGLALIGSRQIYILPTAFGGLYGGALVVLFLGSLNYLNNLGLLFTFLLSGLGLIGMLHTWGNLLGLGVRIGEARPVFLGEPAGFPVQVTPPRDRERPGLSLIAEGQSLSIARDAQYPGSLDLWLPTRKRGRHRLRHLRIETRYPLGLFCAWAYLETPAEVLVYPKPAATAPEVESEGSGSEPTRSGTSGPGVDDFLGLRPYQPGDPLSRLHWKTLAREGGLMVKQFGGGQGETLWLSWDDLAPADPEQRLSLLCRQIIGVAARGDRYGLQLPGRTIQPDSGDPHRHRCLEALALFGAHEAD